MLRHLCQGHAFAIGMLLGLVLGMGVATPIGLALLYFLTACKGSVEIG